MLDAATYNASATTRARGNLLRFDVRYLIAPVLALVFTVWLDPKYTGGDPTLYRYVYDALGVGRLDQGFYFYSRMLDSTEPVYYLTIWTLSHLGVSREIFIGASSAALALLATRLLVARGGSILVATIITSSSFYFLLLYTTTERLKIAFIFLTASLLFAHRRTAALLLAFLATASHIQVAIIYGALLAIYVAEQLRDAIGTRTLPANLIGTAIALVAAVVGTYLAIRDQVASKLISYVGIGELVDLLRVVPFYIATLLYGKNKFHVSVMFLPLLLLTPVIGYGRLNIFSYTIFLYFSIERRRGFNLGVILSTIYFAASSYAFVTRILQFGDPLLTGP